MAQAPQHHGVMVILGGGAASPSGGAVAAGPKAKATLPFPKGFDLQGAQPGDKLDVTVHGQVSPDGKGLVVLGMDGAQTDDDADDTEEGDSTSDDDSSPGDRWDKAVNGGQ